MGDIHQLIVLGVQDQGGAFETAQFGLCVKILPDLLVKSGFGHPYFPRAHPQQEPFAHICNPAFHDQASRFAKQSCTMDGVDRSHGSPKEYELLLDAFRAARDIDRIGQHGREGWLTRGHAITTVFGQQAIPAQLFQQGRQHLDVICHHFPIPMKKDHRIPVGKRIVVITSQSFSPRFHPKSVPEGGPPREKVTLRYEGMVEEQLTMNNGQLTMSSWLSAVSGQQSAVSGQLSLINLFAAQTTNQQLTTNNQLQLEPKFQGKCTQGRSSTGGFEGIVHSHPVDAAVAHADIHGKLIGYIKAYPKASAV